MNFKTKKQCMWRSVVVIMLSISMLLSVCLFSIPGAVSADTAQGDSVKRLIYVVYDDSNSMHWKHLTTWSQAKYSLEIFSAMMQENDDMEVYYMSQFEGYKKGEKIEPFIEGLNGSNPQKNIETIHNAVSDTGGTYIESILYTYDKLKAAGGDYDEKHMVVITDGNEFTGVKPLENEDEADATKRTLNEKFQNANQDGIRVEYLAIGEGAIVPNESAARNVYVEEAKLDGGSILEKVTIICERIFQRPKQDVSGNVLKLSIPVSEVIIFAQGADVSIGDISGMHKSNSVSASLTDADKKKATLCADSGHFLDNGYDDVVVAEGLAGTVAVFKPQSGEYIPEGDYQLNVKGSYSVYYKPCLDVVLKLWDSEGNYVESGSEVNIGNYSVDYYLTYPDGHPKSGEPVSTDFEVAYEFSVNGKLQSGKEIELAPGNTEAKVIAKYLEYISTDESIVFTVADFTVEEMMVELSPEKIDYNLSQLSDNSNIEGYTVKVSMVDGTALTAENWANCELTIKADGVDFDITKNDDQTFLLKPKYKNGNRSDTSSSDVPFIVTATISDGKRPIFQGKDNGVVGIYDDITAGENGFKIEIIEQTRNLGSVDFNEANPYVKVKITWRNNPLTKTQYDNLSLNSEMIDVYMYEDDNGVEHPLVTVECQLDEYVEGAPTTGTLRFTAHGDPETQRKHLCESDEFKAYARLVMDGVESYAEVKGDLNISRVWTPGEIILIIIGVLCVIGWFFRPGLPWRVSYRDLRRRLGNPNGTINIYTTPVFWITLLIPFCPLRSRLDVEYTTFSSGATIREKRTLGIRAKPFFGFIACPTTNVYLTNAKELIGKSIYINGTAKNKKGNWVLNERKVSFDCTANKILKEKVEVVKFQNIR